MFLPVFARLCFRDHRADLDLRPVAGRNERLSRPRRQADAEDHVSFPRRAFLPFLFFFPSSAVKLTIFPLILFLQHPPPSPKKTTPSRRCRSRPGLREPGRRRWRGLARSQYPSSSHGRRCSSRHRRLVHRRRRQDGGHARGGPESRRLVVGLVASGCVSFLLPLAFNSFPHLAPILLSLRPLRISFLISSALS